MSSTRDAFLWQALEEIDGFDGVLLPLDFHNFIVSRDGSCPYTVGELQAWLKEGEPEDEAMSRVEEYNRAIDERNTSSLANREKPWLPLHDGE